MSQELQRVQVGHRVRHARESLGWTQAVLAKRAGISQNTVLSIENGKHQAQPTKLRQVFDALGLSPLGDTTWLNTEGVPADAQAFLTVIAARLAAITDENRRARLMARVYPMLLVDDLVDNFES
jgi:transcriptional regulator with XRE-family HTH domain